MKTLKIFVLLLFSISVCYGCSKRIIENNPKTIPAPQPQNSLQKQKVDSDGEGSNNQTEIKAALDSYRIEAAYEIIKEWVFFGKTTESNKLSTRVVFKVMPDGKIVDIKFYERSGNDLLDNSAYYAIIKASPLEPFPDNFLVPYIEMGLRFTPNETR